MSTDSDPLRTKITREEFAFVVSVSRNTWPFFGRVTAENEMQLCPEVALWVFRGAELCLTPKGGVTVRLAPITSAPFLVDWAYSAVRRMGMTWLEYDELCAMADIGVVLQHWRKLIIPEAKE